MHFDIIYTGAFFATVIGGRKLNKWNIFLKVTDSDKTLFICKDFDAEDIIPESQRINAGVD